VFTACGGYVFHVDSADAVLELLNAGVLL